MRQSTRFLAQWRAIAPEYTAETRLYVLDTPLGKDALLVEGFVGREALSTLYEYRIDCLAPEPALALESLLWQPAVLHIRLADHTREQRSGFISAISRLSVSERFARYRLTVVPWLALAQYRRKSRVYQDLGITDIVREILRGYRDYGDWRMTGDADAFLARVRSRSYCCQYRESDFSFLMRLLAEEGIGFRFEEPETGNALAQTPVLFADSTDFPEDRSAAVSGGIRFHRHDAAETADTIQAFHCARRLQHAATRVASWDYKTRQVISASANTKAECPGRNGAPIDTYDWCGIYAFASQDDAAHYAGLLREAADCRAESWHGRGCVRTMRPGTSFGLKGSLLDLQDRAGANQPARHRFCITSVDHAGINNLPPELGKHIDASLGAAMHFTDEMDWLAHTAMHDQDMSDIEWQDLIAAAHRTGYANRFTAMRSDVVWRPALLDGTGLRLHPRPTSNGPQSALVVGPDGTTDDTGAVHTDTLGRIRIRHHWQREEAHGCWVRVAQLQAGPGYGTQFIPRIGQEVLVHYLDGDIDRPVILGALHNGQGGTCGNASDATGDAASQRHAGEHGRGMFPVWHGATATDGHAGFLSGFTSTALRTDGHQHQSNQLVFDDTRGQLRTMMASDHAATSLNLGYLIHQTGNHRGAYRGTGWELRTDAYGAVCAGKGVLVTTCQGVETGGKQAAAGDNETGITLLAATLDLSQTFDRAAAKWQSVRYFMTMGSAEAGQARQSSLAEDMPPMKALLHALSGTVNAGDGSMSGIARDASIPHCHAPVACMIGKGGIGCAATDGIHIAAGEAAHLSAGQEMQFAAGSELTMHSGQAIGILAGTAPSADAMAGISFRTGDGNIDLEAQNGTLRLSARDRVQIASVKERLDFAAARKITVRTAKGASLHIEGGDITFSCPGTISIRGAVRHFIGPASMRPVLPKFPHSICKQCKRSASALGSPFSRIQDK